MYTLAHNSRRLSGLGIDMDALSQAVEIGTNSFTKVAGAVKGNGGGGSGSGATRQAPAGESVLASLSNTELALGGMAGVALLLGLMR